MNDERYLVHEMRRLGAKIEGLQGEILATQRELERVLEQLIDIGFFDCCLHVK